MPRAGEFTRSITVPRPSPAGGTGPARSFTRLMVSADAINRAGSTAAKALLHDERVKTVYLGM